MISHILHISLNIDTPMTISPRPGGRKRDMIDLLSDENNPPQDTEYIANAKDVKLNNNEI